LGAPAFCDDVGLTSYVFTSDFQFATENERVFAFNALMLCRICAGSAREDGYTMSSIDDMRYWKPLRDASVDDVEHAVHRAEKMAEFTLPRFGASIFDSLDAFFARRSSVSRGARTLTDVTTTSTSWPAGSLSASVGRGIESMEPSTGFRRSRRALAAPGPALGVTQLRVLDRAPETRRARGFASSSTASLRWPGVACSCARRAAALGVPGVSLGRGADRAGTVQNARERGVSSDY